MKFFASLLWMALAYGGTTQTFDAKVTAVPDAASIVVTDSAKRVHTIRLSGIMAVSDRSPIYEDAHRRLSRNTLGKRVTIEWDRQVGKQKFGKVLVEGRDVNLDLIAKGYATHDQQARDYQSTPDRTLYNETEEKARKAGVGMWKERNPATKKKRKSKRRRRH